jgi:hypothetical protein
VFELGFDVETIMAQVAGGRHRKRQRSEGLSLQRRGRKTVRSAAFEVVTLAVADLDIGVLGGDACRRVGAYAERDLPLLVERRHDRRCSMQIADERHHGPQPLNARRAIRNPPSVPTVSPYGAPGAGKLGG